MSSEARITPRERVRRALDFQHPDRPPRHLWALPGVLLLRRAEIEAMRARHPDDFGAPEFRYGEARRARGEAYRPPGYVDAWGCEWVVAEEGVTGEVKTPPLADLGAVANYELPWELLREADLSAVGRSCAESDAFMLAGGCPRPFERLQFLWGTERTLVDLMYGTGEVMKLLERLHEFNLEELTLWSRTAVDGCMFMDDWGSQSALLINPEAWRAIFKPIYRDYCELLRAAGKYVFMHSDGNIMEIYPDLIEVGVHALNSQLFCMDIEELGRRHKGRITFWGEIDRQHVLHHGSTADVRAAVRRVADALYDPSGGVIAQCEWGNQDPADNIAAVFDEWNTVADERAGA